jgi:hypothetical protein
MNNTTNHDKGREADKQARQQLLHTVLLSVAVMLIPILIGFLFVMVAGKIKPAPAAHEAESVVSVANRMHELGSATNKQMLARLRYNLRTKGLPTDEVNLRLWAAELSEPTRIFQIAPPEKNKTWNWILSHDGAYAIAVSVQHDSLDRRDVGLYDLMQGKWLWQNKILWPDSHGQPYVFNGHLILRYSKNALRFALELDNAGRIISIDTLGPGHIPTLSRPPADPALPGLPLAIAKGVVFTADRENPDCLNGYATTRLPGLRYAGKGDDNTIFSGNGFLKFAAKAGDILVYDSLTLTLLQKISAWRHTSNTSVTGMRTDDDGAFLSVFLTTEFAEKPPVRRDWQINLNLYTGQKETLFTQDTSVPERKTSDKAQTPDGRWTFYAAGDGMLTLSCSESNRIAAKLPLDAMGIEGPISDLAFLSGGRHLRIRQGDNFWLLDFAIASGYGDLAARCAANALPDEEREMSPTPNHRLLRPPKKPQDSSLSPDPDDLTNTKDSPPPWPAAMALKAELLAAHQAWGYAADALEKAGTSQERDPRAPGVNLLLLARYQILDGQKAKARETCRAALNKLIADPSGHNRMIRYHLQGLYFAEDLRSDNRR